MDTEPILEQWSATT